MSERNKFQYYLTTGKATFPVAVIFCLVMAGVYFQNLAGLLPPVAAGLTSYLLIELNTSFSLIRTRTTFHAALFLLFYASCVFPHSNPYDIWIPLLFVAGMFFLFQSYESPYASTPIFHSFLCLGLGSLIFPHLLYFIPLMYIFMGALRSLNLRCFCAGLIGTATPYWLLLCYHLYTGNPTDTFRPFILLAHPPHIDYSSITLAEVVSAGVVFILTAVGGALVISKGFQDKVQTRIMLRIMLLTGMATTIMAALLPGHFTACFGILLVVHAVMNSHLLVLTYNKFTQIMTWIILGVWVSLTLYNIIWTDSFSF